MPGYQVMYFFILLALLVLIGGVISGALRGYGALEIVLIILGSLGFIISLVILIAMYNVQKKNE